MELLQLLPLALITIAITFAALLVLRPVALYVGLVDKPSARKLHNGSVPLIGGIGIFCAVVSVVAINDLASQKILPLLGTGAILFLVGLVDDYRPLPVRIRLLVQLACAGLMLFMTDISIGSLGHIFGFKSEIELGLLAVPVTLLAVVGVTNAFNLIDGIDGLAGSLALIAIGGILILQGQTGSYQHYEYLLVLGASLIPYLILNLWKGHRVKIFMGDAGSLFIGYVIVWTLIHQTQVGRPTAVSPTAALWCIAIPLIDTIGVMARRLLKGHSPFKPDRNHLHHILMRAGFSSIAALILLVGIAATLLVAGLVLEANAPEWSFPIFLVVFGGYVYLLRHAWKFQKLLKH